MTSESNAALITKFYTAFQNLNGEEMASLYGANATFKDEAFILKGNEVGSMWKMLTGRAKEFSLVFSNVKGSESGGSADWVATYKYQGRPVINKIHAEFVIQNGLIVDHVDKFNFHTWAKQALGVPGLLFGWFPPFHNAVRKKAMGGLKTYMKKHATES